MTHCQQCGACCRQLVVDCSWHDAVREPRLLLPAVNRHGMTLADLKSEQVCIKLYPCPFLGPDDLCGIYPTRPNTCVGFEPGSEQCEAARTDDLALATSERTT